jgi:hypothetical protein
MPEANAFDDPGSNGLEVRQRRFDMNKLSPAYIATAAVMAFAGATAFAQTGAPAPRATVTQSSGPAPSAPPGNRATVTQNGNNANTTAAGSSNATPSTGNVSAGSTAGTSTDNPGNAPGTTTTTTTTTNGTNNANGIGVLPGSAGVGIAAPADGSASTDANTNTAPNAATTSSQTTTVISTPLLDQATRNANARASRQRATKQEPRVVGIAPRTDADKTDQIPDDKIIRY